MTTPNAIRWSIAAHLAHACGLDWGAWALGYKQTPEGEKILARLLDGEPASPAERTIIMRGADPVPAPARIEDTHEPYREDCRRRNVEPGPMPSWSWRIRPNLDDDMGIDVGERVHINVNSLFAESVATMEVWKVKGTCADDDLRQLLALIEAAERGRKAAT